MVQLGFSASGNGEKIKKLSKLWFFLCFGGILLYLSLQELHFKRKASYDSCKSHFWLSILVITSQYRLQKYRSGIIFIRIQM